MENKISNKNLEESVKEWNPDTPAEVIKSVLIPMYVPYFVGKGQALEESSQVNKMVQYVFAVFIEFAKISMAYGAYELFLK